MNIIFLLIGISLLVALTFLGGFLWAVRSGQYDDSYTPSVRMMFDDEPERGAGISSVSLPEPDKEAPLPAHQPAARS